MTDFNRTTVTAELERVVAEYGEDYVYPKAGYTCSYSESGQPSCIVGHVIAALNPEAFAKIAELEDLTGASGSATSIVLGNWEHTDWASSTDEDEDLGAITLTEDGRLASALNEAQRQQDAGATWGVALSAFYTALAE
jgi:hypothetical protein